MQSIRRHRPDSPRPEPNPYQHALRFKIAPTVLLASRARATLRSTYRPAFARTALAWFRRHRLPVKTPATGDLSGSAKAEPPKPPKPPLDRLNPVCFNLSLRCCSAPLEHGLLTLPLAGVRSGCAALAFGAGEGSGDGELQGSSSTSAVHRPVILMSRVASSRHDRTSQDSEAQSWAPARPLPWCPCWR